MKLKKTALLLSLCTAFSVCASAMPTVPLMSANIITADAASDVFIDVDGNKFTLGDGIPTAVVYGRPECFNTRTTLENIIAAGWLDGGDVRVIFADIDGNNIEKVKTFRDELSSDKVVFCSDENGSGSRYSSRMYSDLDISGSVTLPVIGYYDGTGKLLSYTTSLQQASDVYTALTGKDSPSQSETKESEEKTPVTDKDISDMGYKYEELEDGTIMITEVNRRNGHNELVIPSQIDGKTVTRLGDEAFSYSMSDMFETEYTSVTIPDTVTWIGELCFWHQKKLAKVNAPDTLEHIGANAFNITSWLDTQSKLSDIVILSGIVIEGWHCSDSVTLPDGTKGIADRAFTESYLENIYIPSSVKDIGDSAFAGIKNLTVYCEPGSYAETYTKGKGFKTVTDGTPIPEPDPLKDHLRNPFLDSGTAKLTLNADGTYTMIQSNTYAFDDYNGVNVAILNPEKKTFNHLKCFSKEDEIVCGTYTGEKYNFIIYGNNNYSESNDAIVLRICKYSKEWQHLGDLEIKGANTYEPTKAGYFTTDEYDGKLYIHTCHTMYGTVHHQANMSFIIDEEKLEVLSSNTGISTSALYTSHSFDQDVAVDETGAYFADLGDGYPRAVALTYSDQNTFLNSRQLSVFDIKGATGDNSTGVYLGNLLLTDSKCLLSFASIDQQEENSFNGPKDLYITVLDKKNKKYEVKKISEYSADKHNSAYGGGMLIKAGKKNYLIWSQGDAEYLADGTENPDYSEDNSKLVRAEISGDGEIVGDILEVSDLDLGWMLPCEDGMIRYVNVEKRNDDHVTLYTVDPSTMKLVSSDTYTVKKDASLGDVNYDGSVDASDASDVLAHYALVSTGAEPGFTAEQITLADVNSDGNADASDASSILAYYALVSTSTGTPPTMTEFMSKNT